MDYNNSVMRGKMRDLTGLRVGRLTVIKQHHQDKHRRWHWICKCDCGNEKIIESGSLVKGSTLSCGCLNKEILRSGVIRRTHGLCKNRLHATWSHMTSRCLNKNNCDYKKWYGGRGISVCDEWCNNFKAFYDWAIVNGYDESLTLDRIDVNGDYCPENCRWVSSKQQANNRRNTRKLTYNGETHSVSEWADILGIKYTVLNARVHYGWDDERVLTQPVRKSPKRKKE